VHLVQIRIPASEHGNRTWFNIVENQQWSGSIYHKRVMI
jgi:hypothetical protein